MGKRAMIVCLLACVLAGAMAAGELAGRVTFRGLAIPGAKVTAVRANTSVSVVTAGDGSYSFGEVADGTWRVEVETFGFERAARDVAVSPGEAPVVWELTMLPLGRIKAKTVEAPKEQASGEAPAAAKAEQGPDEQSQDAAEGFLLNGSLNNGAASPFGQNAAFGNNRFGGRNLYNGGIGITFDNSALDAAPYSLSGQNTEKPSYNRMTGLLAVGGPLRIPHLLDNGPMFFLGYQWTRNNTATTASALMPTAAERAGVLNVPVFDPATGTPFPGNVVPRDRISPQATALLGLYPLPNFVGSGLYNYQAPIVSPAHQDAMQTRLLKTLGKNDQVNGRFAFESTRTGSPNLFGFLDTTDILGLNAAANWTHRMGQEWFLTLGYQFSRLSTRVTPYFQNRVNVSGEAGITGNNQEPANWGPPALGFASGIAGLSDAQSAFDRNETNGVSASTLWTHGSHNLTLGADFRRQEFNYLSQQDPRGTFTFTGAASGSDLGDFLLGIPDTSSIAYGNADKYFRESVYDAYVADDWKVRSDLTLNLGLRWEYGAPITELYGRLVNLDIAPGYSAAAPVVANDPVGTLTGERYPASLIQPDRNGFEPRLGIAWRPLAGSSTVIRAGYGIYYDTSVYQTIAAQMGQQPPLSNTLSVSNTPENPLTLANGFVAPAGATRNTFAVDPNFRVGYAQNWQFSVQQDLPGSIQMTASYLGIKGTRGMQEFLPNTYPIGAANPCPACPAGFAYLTSNGNSSREAAEIQLRRRLHNGFAAALAYTYSKSIDDVAALGGQSVAAGPPSATQGSMGAEAGQAAIGPANLAMAQNWLDLAAERGLSVFDQRHVLNLQLQYTSGMGLGGGTLRNGWIGALLKEWTLSTVITAASGLPQTPVYLAAVPGTGVTGTIRPAYTGAPLYQAPVGLNLNPAAYAPPAAGEWGNAGRNSITGPAEFALDASLGRTFRMTDRLNLDVRVDATNALNHVNYTAWNTTINSAQFGLAAAANAMRSMQTTVRLRF
jgi:hypothetical protein